MNHPFPFAELLSADAHSICSLMRTHGPELIEGRDLHFPICSYDVKWTIVQLTVMYVQCILEG